MAALLTPWHIFAFGVLAFLFFASIGWWERRR